MAEAGELLGDVTPLRAQPEMAKYAGKTAAFYTPVFPAKYKYGTGSSRNQKGH